MRILFLALDVDLSRQRGDTTHAVELANAFAQVGHEVAMVVGAPGRSHERMREGVSIHVLAGTNRSVLAGIKRILREFHADIIYERRSTPKIGFAVRSRWSLPLVMELNGILSEELRAQGKDPRPGTASGWKGMVRGIMFRRVDQFVAVSKAIADDLVSTYGVDPSRVHVIGNGVDTERFTPMSKLAACQHVKVSPGQPRLVFVGNLVGWRDFDTLLAAIRLAQREVPDIQLLIVGDGPERKHLEEVASRFPQHTVVLTGEVPRTVVAEYIGAADICVLAERTRSVDISPMKLFEYLSCTRPVIAFSVKGLEIVESLRIGLLAEPGDADGLSRHIVRLLGDPVLCAEMGARGRALVAQSRTWQHVATRITQILDDVVGART